MRTQNQFARKRAMTTEEIRNLVTPKYEPEIGRISHNQTQNHVENSRRNESSYMPMQMGDVSNYSQVLDNSGDGSYLNSTQSWSRI